MKPAVSGTVIVLDRDGTIVVDKHYLDDPDELEFLPNAAAGLRLLYEAGHRLIVATNQSGVGRGRFSLARLHEVNARLEQMIEACGARLEATYYCPHAPTDQCACRKPNIGMLRQAAAQLRFDAAAAIVVGDKLSDIEFGARAGAVTMLVANAPAPIPPQQPAPDFVVPDLVRVAQIAADADLLGSRRATR